MTSTLSKTSYSSLKVAWRMSTSSGSVIDVQGGIAGGHSDASMDGGAGPRGHSALPVSPTRRHCRIPMSTCASRADFRPEEVRRRDVNQRWIYGREFRRSPGFLPACCSASPQLGLLIAGSIRIPDVVPAAPDRARGIMSWHSPYSILRDGVWRGIAAQDPGRWSYSDHLPPPQQIHLAEVLTCRPPPSNT